MSQFPTTNHSHFLPYLGQELIWGPPDGVGIMDIIPDDVKPLIHPHWAKFPPVNPMWHYLLAIIFIILGVLSFFGNGTVMYLFALKKSLRTPANMFVVNLAFSDFMMMLSQFPMYVYNCFYGGYWLFGKLGCEIHAYTGGICGLGSLLTLVAIGYDRYSIIVKAFDGGHISYKKALVLILMIWTYAGCAVSGPFWGFGAFIPEGILTSCSFDYVSDEWHIKSLGLFLFTICFCFPMTFIIFFYTQIVIAIRNHERTLREQAKKMNVENLRSNDNKKGSAEVRIAKVAVLNVGLWLITWVPYAYVVLTAILGDKMKITPLISALPGLICKTASCYNPILFAISHPKFRLALQEAMPWFCIHEEKDDETKSSKTETENSK